MSWTAIIGDAANTQRKAVGVCSITSESVVKIGIGIVIVIALFLFVSRDETKTTEPVTVVTPLDAIPHTDEPSDKLPTDVVPNNGTNGINGSNGSNGTNDPVDAKVPADAVAKVDDTKDDTKVDDTNIDDKGDDKRPFAKKSSGDKNKKTIEVDKNLAEAGRALITGKFEEAVRLSKEVLGESGVNGDDKERARNNIKAACTKQPATKGCSR